MMKHQQKKSGFTLVEIMVAISIFSIIALIVVQAFISIDRVNRKAQAMKTIIDNLHYALNAISFNLQQGGTYHCLSESDIGGLSEGGPSDWETYENFGEDCPVGSGGGPGIVFRSPKSGSDIWTIIYKFDDAGDGKKRIWFWQEPASGQAMDFAPMTVDNLVINEFRFYVHNSASANATPRVFFTIDGVARLDQDFETPFQLQTMVSERI